MALTEENVIDKIEIINDGCIQVRKALVIKRDGVELSRTFERYCLTPRTRVGDAWQDTDVSDQPSNIQSISSITWTDEVKSAYEEKINITTLPQV